MLYECDEIRQHILNCRVKEHTRGWRLIKGRDSAKIDLAIALAMACQAAQDKLLLKTQAGFIGSADDDIDDLDFNRTIAGVPMWQGVSEYGWE